MSDEQCAAEVWESSGWHKHRCTRRGILLSTRFGGSETALLCRQHDKKVHEFGQWIFNGDGLGDWWRDFELDAAPTPTSPKEDG